MSATVRRDLKEPVAPVERSHEERVTFRWRRFLLLTYLVVTASTAQLCLMTQDEIRERKLRETQETRNRIRSANREQQVAGRKGKFRNQKSSPTVIPATIDRDLEPSKRPPTGESVSQERIPGMDDVSVMWSPLESKDGPGRHSGEDGNDNRTTSVNTPLPRMCLDDATTTPSAHSCSAAQPTAEQVMVLDSDSVRSEESFTMLNVPAESAVTQQEQQFLLEQLLHLSSSGITDQEARRAIVRMFPDRQQKIKVSKAVRTLQDTMQKT